MRKHTLIPLKIPRLTEENNCHIFSLQIYIYSLSLDCGVVHAWVDQKVMPFNLILRLFLYHFLHTMSL
jgi:hypothetical protein